MEIHEDFLDMYQLEHTDVQTITSSIKDILLRCNLKLENCRWQSYDGAANMSGIHSGVAARISSEYPCALYIHCANHCLDLALQGCTKSSTTVRDSLNFCQELSVFIRVKRMC